MQLTHIPTHKFNTFKTLKCKQFMFLLLLNINI